MNLEEAQKIGIAIGEIIDGKNPEDVKIALMGIWDLIFEMEKEQNV